MRKVTASLALLIVAVAVFAPVAHATVLRNAHACCFKKQQSGRAVSRSTAADPAQHACCSLATLHATPAANKAQGSRPLPAHPFVTEFYPAADSSDAAPNQANRAPPASDPSE
ncbi:MAG: hypothetical protein M3P27_05490 [Acidobacteriota bacterium]|nr:hypothetical protein [Acidobacteriota bacterium]